ncbi:MAG: hypothetical protein GF419_11665, partial [Ignavibacteriales bacterium]|nr:hypothetical protein [Ignavibacteriales bacterium]
MDSRILSGALFVFLTTSALPQNAIAFDYVYPVNGSEGHPPQTRALFRASERFDERAIEEANVRIVGSLSGEMNAVVRLADDGRSVSVFPEREYQAGERVEIEASEWRTIDDEAAPSVRVEFTIREALPEPSASLIVNAYPDYTIDPRTADESFAQTLSSADTASLPAMTVTHTGTTGEGAVVGSIIVTDPSYISYNFAIDDAGDAVYCKTFPSRTWDFTRHANGLFSYGRQLKSYGGFTEVEFVLLDENLTEFDTVQMVGGYTADHHHFEILPNGNRLVEAYDIRQIDMSEIVEGGKPNAFVIGSVLQEIDADGDLVFQWRSWDHIPINDSFVDLTQNWIDYMHTNAFIVDIQGDYLASARHLSQIFKIDRRTGEVVWRLGGEKNDFAFVGEDDSNAPWYFSMQHDVRRLANGNILIFDNGNQHSTHVTRVVEYDIDDSTMTATPVWEWSHPDGVKSGHSGNSRRLPNGNTIIGWGSSVQPSVTEVNSAGEIVWEMSHDEATYMYRAHRVVWDEQAATESVTRSDISSYGTPDFNDFGVETGISLIFGDVWGEATNSVTVDRSPFTPSEAAFVDPEPKAYQATISITGVAIDSFEATARLDLSKAPYVELPDEAVALFRAEGADTFRQVSTTWISLPDALEFEAPGFGEYVFVVPIDESDSYAPLLVDPAEGEIVDGERAYPFLWNPRGVARSFDIEIDTSAAFTNPLIEARDLASARFDYDPEYSEQTYYWRVRAKNLAGTSDWSDVRSFTAEPPFFEIQTPEGGESIERFTNALVSARHNVHRREIVFELWRDDALVETVYDDELRTGGFLWDVGGVEAGEGYSFLA